MTQIDVLPDDVLLEIFYFYVETGPLPKSIRSDECKAVIEAWQLLVHVCRRWRSLVFGSPRRLNLRLYCTPKTLMRDALDVWPAFPLVVDSGDVTGLPSDTDNFITVLGQSNRICQVNFLEIETRKMDGVLAAMQVPFPELTDLRFSLFRVCTDPPTIPDSFLGGSAPRLRSFELRGFSFPGLPKLLLSATHLVDLKIINIPYSRYISPQALVAIISVLPGLRILALPFQFRQSRSAGGWQNPGLPLPKRSILPALVEFHFRGVNEYLEDLMAHIDAPQLDQMDITFFNQIDLDCSLLAQFINRSPTLRAREAHVQFYDYFTKIMLITQFRTTKIIISCTGSEPDLQLSTIAQVCSIPLHPLSAVEGLYIVSFVCRNQRFVWKDDTIEQSLWLRLLLPFAAVKNLYLSKEFAPGIAATLELVGGRITEVLPSLQKIFVERLDPSGPVQENIGQFVAARQLSDHPIAISFWQKDYYCVP